MNNARDGNSNQYPQETGRKIESQRAHETTRVELGEELSRIASSKESDTDAYREASG